MENRTDSVWKAKRRDWLKLAIAGTAAPLLGRSNAQPVAKPLKTPDELDPGNIKLSHRVSIRATDDDLLFLKQIGLRFFRAEIPNDAEPGRHRPSARPVRRLWDHHVVRSPLRAHRT